MVFRVVQPVAPGDEPFTIGELRQHCRVPVINGTHPDDALILMYASAAREYAERYCGRPFAKQTVRLELDYWPSSMFELDYTIDRPEEVAVSYVDENGVTQTLAADQYMLAHYVDRWVLVRPSHLSWPTSAPGSAGLAVQYVVGTGHLPHTVRAALLLFTDHLYSNRAAVQTQQPFELPLGVANLLNFHRVNVGV